MGSLKEQQMLLTVIHPRSSHCAIVSLKLEPLYKIEGSLKTHLALWKMTRFRNTKMSVTYYSMFHITVILDSLSDFLGLACTVWGFDKRINHTSEAEELS